MELSYANSVADLCARVGADVDDVTRSMGADPRIGAAFQRPGPGWGGSCLPKDTAALVHVAQMHCGVLAEVEACRVTNAGQAARIAEALERNMSRPLDGARVTALGLAFKAHTSDTRDSPALAVCEHLTGLGANVYGFDPRLEAIDPAALQSAGVTAVDDPHRAMKATDSVVVDTRNVADADAVRRAGLKYVANGRPGGY